MGFDCAEPALDEIVAGKYRLTRLIGRGGMGSVWEGVHLTLGNKVAVKFIDPAFAESPEARQRFENEARAAARLNSKYAVQVYDHGMMSDGRPFIVMEFLIGEPLDARLDRDGRLAPQETAKIVSQVCRALARAHSAGIVHRDLKPENVFLVWDEEDNANVAKVVDFGIAKFTDNQAGISSSTRTGSVLGTPYYMSPEQARGLRSVDYRTDLWSLGVIAYRCIVGRLPFEGESVGDLLVKICTSPIPIPSSVAPDCPVAFDTWFARALQREPGARFTTAQELAEQLMLACGLSVGRQPLPSGQHGYAAGADAHALGQMTPGAGVPGVTAQPAAVTDGAFAKTNLPSGRKKKLAWVASGCVALICLGASGALLIAKRQPADAQTDPRNVVVASGALGPSSSPATQTAAVPSAQAPSPEAVRPIPSITVDSVSGAGVASAAAVPVRGAKSPTGIAPTRGQNQAHSSATPPAAARPPEPPASPPARRPAANRPIDVGY
jgi:eukaryotic-like serine/threonine-protein kinase